MKAKVVVASGKRKTAIARVVMRTGKGRVRVSDIPLELYEPEVARLKIAEPLALASEKTLGGLDINVEVKGGGFMGQAEAARTAIARGLIEWTDDEKLKQLLKDYDRTMMSGDPRRSEAKKFGGPGARRRKQKSYR